MSLVIRVVAPLSKTTYLPEELMVEEHYEYYVEVMKKAGLEHEIHPTHGGGGYGRRKEDHPL